MFVWLVFFNKDFLSNFLMNSRKIDVAKAVVVYMVNQVDLNTKVSGLFLRDVFLYSLVNKFGSLLFRVLENCVYTF